MVPPDEVFARKESEFVQDSLALDFLARDELFAHQLSARAELPDPAPWLVALAQAFVEVMAGLPPPQVSRWTSPEVYAALCRRAAVATAGARPLGGLPWCVGCGSKSLLTELSRRAQAVVIQQDRVRALALRLTGLDRRWIVTELSVG